MTQRSDLVEAYIGEQESMAELARRYGVSRKTAYKWVSRYLAGMELGDRSRRPRTSPKAVAAWLEEAIVSARRDKPRWGPKKLRAVLAKANPGVELPSVSTIAAIFKRNGLVVPRRRRRRATPSSTTPLLHATGPNALWCIDFKGDFELSNGKRCYPLTITDAYSRYIIAIVALPSTETGGVRRALERIFDQFGLPEAIRSDNGSPFASNAPCGLSELSAWWHKLGIRHERIDPGAPEQNGRHERMHGTLKAEATQPPQRSLREQQRVFDRFRAEYNDERPHEALGQKPPADFYQRAERRLPSPPWGRPFEYPGHFEVIRVNKTGTIGWNNKSVFITAALRHELLGFECQPNRDWAVYFGDLFIGTLTRKHRKLVFGRVTDPPQRRRQVRRSNPTGLQRGEPVQGLALRASA